MSLGRDSLMSNGPALHGLITMEVPISASVAGL